MYKYICNADWFLEWQSLSLCCSLSMLVIYVDIYSYIHMHEYTFNADWFLAFLSLSLSLSRYMQTTNLYHLNFEHSQWNTLYHKVLILRTSTIKSTLDQNTEHTATHCNTLQHTATQCNTLQHTATHCNTPSKVL